MQASDAQSGALGLLWRETAIGMRARLWRGVQVMYKQLVVDDSPRQGGSAPLHLLALHTRGFSKFAGSQRAERIGDIQQVQNVGLGDPCRFALFSVLLREGRQP